MFGGIAITIIGCISLAIVAIAFSNVQSGTTGSAWAGFLSFITLSMMCGGVAIVIIGIILSFLQNRKTNKPPTKIDSSIVGSSTSAAVGTGNSIIKSSPAPSSVSPHLYKSETKTSFMDIFHVKEMKAELLRTVEERDSLKNALSDIDKMEYHQLKQAIENLGSQKEKALQEIQAVKADFGKQKQDFDQQLSELAKQIDLRKKEIIVLDDEILLESFALYKPQFKFQTSEEYKIRLDTCRDKQKQLIKNGIAVKANENWTVNNSKVEGRKMVNDMKKLMLRSFNNECEYCVDNVKFNNMEVNEKRIEKSFEELNKLGRIMQASLADSYKKLKYEELYLAFEYQQKKQAEKEELKRAREELREQQKVEQEIRQAREKIAKEKKHFVQAINDLELKLKETDDDSVRALVLEKLEEVKGQYSELEKEEKVIDYREKNAKAGYVYIISNIGSFGEHVYKIGMTRRLEPLERIDELGDASVPFGFDVHGLIFSDNAPALEAKLHEHFYKSRINKLNHRKEFFKADIHEIEKIVKENYDKVIDIVKDAPAEQYREGLLII
jgi:hypothetical protein